MINQFKIVYLIFIYEISSDIDKRTQFVVTLDSRRDFRSYDMQKSANNSETTKEVPKRKRAPSPTNAGKPVKKLIIQNDTEDEEELRNETENSASTSTNTKRKSIKFDETDPNKKRVRRENSRSMESATGPIAIIGKLMESECNDKSRTSDLLKIRTSKSSGNKYENLPSRKLNGPLMALPSGHFCFIYLIFIFILM